jgi:hypothetical protein
MEIVIPRELIEPSEGDKRYMRRGKREIYQPADEGRPLATSRPALESQDHREEGRR